MNCHLSDYRICLEQISKWLRRDARQVSDLSETHEPLRSPGSKTPTPLIHSRQVEDLPRISMAQPGGKVSWVTLAPLTYSALNAAPSLQPRDFSINRLTQVVLMTSYFVIGPNQEHNNFVNLQRR